MNGQRALYVRCALFDQRDGGLVLMAELARKGLDRAIERIQSGPRAGLHRLRVSAERALYFRCALIDQLSDGCALVDDLGRKGFACALEGSLRRPRARLHRRRMSAQRALNFR